MRNPLIVFEGLDCTGKTTLAQLATKQLCDYGYNAYYHKNNSAVANNCSSTKDFIYYGMVDEITEVLPLLEKGIVVQDRYYFSLLNYHNSIHGGNEWDITWQLFTRPDLVVYLTSDDGVRLKRWDIRGRTGIRIFLEDMELAHKADAEYRRLLLGHDCFFLDTSHLAPEDAFRRLYPAILGTVKK